MRILFLTGTSTGGAARSTEQLACRLHDRDHHVAVLSGWRPQPEPLQLEEGHSVLWRRATIHLSRSASALRRLAGGRPAPLAGPHPAWRSRFPELALPPVLDLFQPEVVVVSALARRPWPTVRRHLADTGIPCALYVRTADQVDRLSVLPLARPRARQRLGPRGAGTGRGGRTGRDPIRWSTPS